MKITHIIRKIINAKRKLHTKCCGNSGLKESICSWETREVFWRRSMWAVSEKGPEIKEGSKWARRGKHSEQKSKEARNHGTFPCNILAGGPVGSFDGKVEMWLKIWHRFKDIRIWYLGSRGAYDSWILEKTPLCSLKSYHISIHRVTFEETNVAA